MDNTNYEKEIDARDLININRLDIIAKYKYVEDKLKKLDCKFIKELYIKTVEAYTNGTFWSCEHNDKKGVKKFLQYFDNTIDNIVKNGFDYKISKLTMDKNGVILDGGHRIAILAYLNKKVIVHNRQNFEMKDNPELYKKRLLEVKYLDYLVLEYYKMTQRAFLLITTKEIEISKEFNLIYKKDIKLNYIAIKNLHKILLKDTIGEFKGKRKFYVYILEKNYSNNNSQTILNKDNILYELKEKEEIEKIIYMLLNTNSIRFLNLIELDNYINIDLKIQQLKEKIQQKKYDINNIATFGNFINEYYNISNGNIFTKIVSINDLEIYKENIELILNPDNYMYFENIKIIISKQEKNILDKKYKEKDLFSKTVLKLRILIRNVYFNTKQKIRECVGIDNWIKIKKIFRRGIE